MLRLSFKKLLTPALIGLLALSLAACGNSNNSAPAANGEASASPSASASPAASTENIVIEHELGKIELDHVPQRIVVMEFSYADALTTLGVQPIGVADDGDAALLMDVVKEKLGNYTSVGSRYEPNIELISSLQPDLIIADLNHHKNVYDQLNAVAPTLVLNDHLADYNTMLSNYAVIAKAVGKEAEGQKRLEEHKQIIDEAKAKIKNSDLTILPAVVNPKGFFAHSDHSYVGSFLTSLGFNDPVKDEESYPQLTLEQLVETNPQAIFLLPTEEVTIVNEWEKNPLWSKIDAVTNDKVFSVERRNWALSRGLLGSEHVINDLVSNLGE
ncbi:Fe(3+) dicitrate ABC transporter substrate-binding protein [Paenibacillus sp. NEAU-GSW1]|uniref:ABC transporter substrate-binding protein n=1 Tax=Paenibacillus sp. NEAU-GSW1 TaxID=2682486 RepID=UPI0012E2A5D8|nr:Fe(3+) dicitrate ABC transporter substrate-binding protein [Paenibacillus sp. NEAU-GSW1]MUT66097.1 ABC transporter substrate-binding protein [Paenibacillus sp. NEAU-GSW1]